MALAYSSPSTPPDPTRADDAAVPASSPALDRVAALLRILFDVPVVLVSRVVDNRLRFLATVGFSVRDAEIDYLPCGEVVAGNMPVIVDDADAVPDWTDRYAKGIGFYAGVPLRDAGGAAVGALSMIDVAPKQLEATALGVLEAFAALVSDLLDQPAPPTPAPARALSPTAAMLVDLFHDTSAAVVLTDPANRVLAGNDAFQHLFGAASGDGDDFGRLLAEPDRLADDTRYHELLAGACESYHATCGLAIATGGVNRGRMTVSLVRDDAGQPGYAIRMIEQLGETPAPGEAVRLGDQVIAHMPLAMVLTDRTIAGSPIVSCNPAFERLTGYAQHDVFGSHMRLLHGIETRGDAVADLERLMADEETGSVTLRLYARDGTAFDGEVTVVPVRNDDGVLTRYIWLIADRTADVAARDEIEALRTELHRSTLQLQRAVELTAVAYQVTPLEREVQDVLQELHRAIAFLEARVVVFDDEGGDGQPLVANVAGNPINFDQPDAAANRSGRVICRIKMHMETAGEQGNWCLDVPLLTQGGMRGLLTLYARPERRFGPDETALAQQAARRIVERMNEVWGEPLPSAHAGTDSAAPVPLLPEADG